MDNTSFQYIVTGVAFISSLSGLFFNIFATNKPSNALIKRREHCEKFVMTKIRENIDFFAAHLKGEVDRMLEFIYRKVANGKRDDGEDDEEDSAILGNDFMIQNFELRSLNIEYKETFSDIQSAFKDIRNINRAINGIKCFRWVFWFIFSVVLVLGFILFQWPNVLPEKTPTYVLAVSIISVVCYALFVNIANGIIEKTEKEYGI